jgi:hypothetical protein
MRLCQIERSRGPIGFPVDTAALLQLLADLAEARRSIAATIGIERRGRILEPRLNAAFSRGNDNLAAVEKRIKRIRSAGVKQNPFPGMVERGMGQFGSRVGGGRGFV